MSMELIAIISLGLTVITVGIMLAGLILNGQRTQQKEIKTVQDKMTKHQDETRSEFKVVRAEIQGLRTETQSEFKTVRAEIQGLRTETQSEFKTVREVMGGLRERMAHLEGLIEGLREAITGRRVAEDPGEYGTN